MSITSDRVHDIKKSMELEEIKLPSLTRLLRAGNFGMAMICYPVLFYHLRRFMILLVLGKNFRKFSFKHNMRLIGEYFMYLMGLLKRKRLALSEYKTLRKIVWNDMEPLSNDNEALIPLRKGR